MAISKKHKEKLLDLLLIDNTYTKQKLVSLLGVAPNWISRNLEELTLLGFNLDKESKVTNKEIKLLNNLLDLKCFNYFLLKHYINKAYIYYGLVAPFQLELKEIRNNIIASDLIDKIDDKINETSFNYLGLLRDIIECEDPLSPININNFPLNLSIYLKTLYDSFNLLQDIIISSDTRLIINNTFKDLFNIEPTEEQLQVVSKAINYASSVNSYKSVSIQADAGSSKSTCAVVIQTILRANLNPLIVAKTNKAISGMSNAKTIAKFLQENVGLSVTKDSWEERKLKAYQKKDSIDFVIVDESSQVGELDRIILNIVCKKILFMGDKNQCKPIHDKQAVESIYLHSLKSQYRFFNSEMKIDNTCFQSLFTSLHKEKRREKITKLFETSIIGSFYTEGSYVKEETSYILKNNYEQSFNNFIPTLFEYVNDNCIILAYSQNAVDTINYILNDGKNFKINSKVSLKVNDYTQNQYNGYQYRIIEEYPNNKFKCKSIENGTEYIFPGSWLDLSYALTTMCSQGSSWEYVLGIDKTCPNTEIWTDRYVIITRASKKVSFLTSNGFSSSNKLINVDIVLNDFKEKAKEGNRNNMLYGSLKDLIKLDATESDYQKLYELAIKTDLPKQEVDNIFEHNLKSNICLEYLKPNKIKRTKQYFTPIFYSGKTLKGVDRVLTYEEALNYPNTMYVAEELKESNRIVIDCDSKDTVEKFIHLIDKTESYINEDYSSLHLVFTTDKLIPTKHKKEIDLLGNEKHSLRNIKNNKTYNNLKAIKITQDILDIFNGL